MSPVAGRSRDSYTGPSSGLVTGSQLRMTAREPLRPGSRHRVMEARSSIHQGIRLKRQLGAVGFLIALITLPSCSSESSDPEGMRVKARQDVMLSDNPLGDVAVGDLEPGEEVTALCFVRRAQTNTGRFGSAIKVRTGDVTGYAAVTDFPEDPAERQAIFDLDAEALRDRLPACSP